MQVVDAVVLIERIAVPIQLEFRACDPVADPADDRAEIAVVLFVFRKAVVAEHHVDPRAVRVFYAETSERRAVVQNLKRQGVALDAAERDGFAENGTSPRNCCDLNCHNWLLLCAPHCAFFSCSISRPCSASCSACSRTTDLSRRV